MATTKNTKSHCKELLVVAIDFGTTYSGYAFSFRSQFEKDPTNISANTVWTSGSNSLVSLKAPTVLLLHWIEDEQEFTVEEFGYDAEDKYDEYVANDEEENYYLVKHFKMDLHNQTAASGLNRNTVYSVDEGKSIKLTTLFCMGIRFLRKHCMKTLRRRDSGLKKDDIHWVLTVPAIWTDAGKQIMMEAAVEAGINSEKLTLVLEPEAASLFCLHMPSVRSDGQMLAEGTKYMVVDAGGGTVDINIHQVQEGQSLIELHAATGGPFGGTMVDHAFTLMLTKIFGAEIFDQVSKNRSSDWLDLQREFEVKKRNFDSKKKNVMFKPPVSFLKGTPISEVVNECQMGNTVKVKGDKIMLDASVMFSFFKDSCDNIATLIEEILFSKPDERIETIVLVGGYGESRILQDAIESRFLDKTVIVPEEAGLAVLKGAVIYGHSPGAVRSRVAQRTYGIDETREFVEGEHPEHKKIDIDGSAYCCDCFRIYIKKGQDIKLGETLCTQMYEPLKPNQTKMGLNIYSSTEIDPKFVTDPSCTWLGKVSIAVPNADDGVSRGVDVTFQFDTQIKVTAVAEATKQEAIAFIDFLSGN